MSIGKEPDRPMSVDERIAWRKQKVRRLVRVHKVIEENGRPFVELLVSGWPERIHYPQASLPARYLPVQVRDIFVARVNINAEATRDIEIEFDGAIGQR